MPLNQDDRHPRPLTNEEFVLARWLLEHGGTEAKPFLDQLERATATTWRCGCGCASYNFLVAGMPPAPPGVHIFSDYFNDDDKWNAVDVFIYESGGILSGVEVVGYGDVPAGLPDPAKLRPLPPFASRPRPALHSPP